jgi:two-component sensor histidine kinase
MGTQLVKAFAAQLGGRIEVERGATGSTQRLIFPVAPPGDTERAGAAG